jgi:Tfp pilus assembly PilM family ATPase
VNAFQFTASTCVFMEIGQGSLKVLDGDRGLELKLERLANGRLTSSCRERLSRSLREFLRRKRWRRPPRAFCAIGARGVSLRRLSLPPSTKEGLQQLLLLQIEKEFPLPPSELAWGYSQLNREKLPQNGGAAPQELIAVAAKREMIQDYSEIFSYCGLRPVFTLGALTASSICPSLLGSCGVLDIGRSHSELICFDHGAPTTIRILPWGGEDITSSIKQKLHISHEEAEKLKVNSNEDSVSKSEHGPEIQSAVQAALNELAGPLRSSWTGQKLYVTGASARLAGIVPWLAEALGDGVQCERIEIAPGEGRSAAILGLQRSSAQNRRGPALTIHVTETGRGGESRARPAHWKWAALAALLAIGSISFRYAEALVRKPGLSRRVSEIKAYRAKLPKIDQELGFLQYLEKSQPPYLNAISILANAAGPGTRLDSLSINRQGDLSLRGTMQNSQQATDFRSKLIASGLFSMVGVAEQTPTPDRQRIVVRIIAQVKSDAPKTIDATSSSEVPGGQAAANKDDPKRESRKEETNLRPQ